MAGQSPRALESDPSIPSAVSSFVTNFYSIGDTPHANTEYSSCFTPQGVAIVMGKERKGQEEILAWRQTAWDFVVKRSHVPFKLYAKGPREVCVFGEVKMWFKDGTTDGDDFVAFMELEEVDGQLKMKRYEARGLK
ncbi:hypothetical protein T439DRAFT_328484 [Meredithblackwellia eburnea MCA 4105]